MSMDAFLRQGFLPFDVAVERQSAELTGVVGVLRSALASVSERPARPAFVAIGASLAAVGPAVDLLTRHGIPARRINAAELEHRSTDVGDLVIAVSQSGRSRETVGALQHITVPTIALVNVADSPIAELANSVISLGDLPDSLASTIGYSATVVAASMLAETWTDGAPSVHWDSLGERLDAFLPTVSDHVARLAESIHRAAVVDVIAPVEHLGTAEAAGLLLREVPRVPAAAFESRQYLHGLMEAAGPDALHIVVDGADSIHMLPRFATARRQVVVFVPSGAVAPAEAPGALAIALPTLSPAETPIFAGAVMQRAALIVARNRAIDPGEFLFLDTDIKLGDDAFLDNDAGR